jgi:hypothetical protein
MVRQLARDLFDGDIVQASRVQNVPCGGRAGKPGRLLFGFGIGRPQPHLGDKRQQQGRGNDNQV